MGLSCPAGRVGTLRESDIVVGLGRQVVVRGGVPLHRVLAGEGDVLERGARAAVVPRPRGGGDVLLDAVAALWVAHGCLPWSGGAATMPAHRAAKRRRPPPRRWGGGRRAVGTRRFPEARRGGSAQQGHGTWARCRPEDDDQRQRSSTSMRALSVFSTIARSEDSRGSTWVAKKRVAASLPS